MLIGILFTTLILLCVPTAGKTVRDTSHFDGNYYMYIPGDGNQYVFNIYWSPPFNRYIVTVIAQTLSWATATLTVVNDTSVNLVCDDGTVLSGVVSYPTDLPSICWPTSKDFTCWQRLLSNVTRIHVINM